MASAPTATTPRDRLTERLRALGSPVLCAHHVSLHQHRETIAKAQAAGEPVNLAQLPGVYAVRPHLVLIDRAIRHAIATGGRLIIEAPPRHGKSEAVSRYLPFWYLGTYPERRVILASYEATFAATWGRKARELMHEHGERLWGLRVRADSRAVASWDLEGHAGGMVTAGVGGPLTGKGGHLIVVDDPVKNAKEAMSPVYRQAAWEWYQSTLRTRLEPGGAMVLMATRWHKDDLLGRVMRESDEDWIELRLPALAEEDAGVEPCPDCEGQGARYRAGTPVNCESCGGSGQMPSEAPGDPLGREPGEALWPERYDAEYLEARRREAPYWFAAMYQGDPRPMEGGIFNAGQRRYWRPGPELDGLPTYDLDDGTRVITPNLRIFATVDVAASEKQTADYTVVSTWGWSRIHGQLLLLDRTRLRQATPKHRGLIRTAHARWGHSAVAIEASTYGLALLQELRTSGLPLHRLEADRDKVTRALEAAALYENGQVHHPHGAPWLAEWEDELDDFPNGEHDDQVDTAGYAARMVASWANVAMPSDRGEDEMLDRNDPTEAGYEVSL